MIIKLHNAGKNEAIFVNFDYVRTIRRDGSFTELTMSDDKYHKLAVLETPEEIYDALYPPKSCADTCNCDNAVNAMSTTSTQEPVAETATATKKATTKKASTAAEQN